MTRSDIIKKCTAYLLFSLIIILICFLFFLYYESSRRDEAEEKSAAVEATPYPSIILDPGHGGEDGGCVGKDGTTEKDLNLSLSQKTYSLMSAAGLHTIMTRTDDRLLYDRYNDLTDYKGKKKIFDVKNRVRLAEEYSFPIFLSIHMNAFPDKKYSGTQIYYSANNSSSKMLAETLQETVKEYLQKENNREIKKASSSIYVLDRLRSPAVLVECGFLSNDAECAQLRDEEYQKKMAVILCAAMLNFTEEYLNQG
ncbi:MAG: N-acetylmuramoyl-L-alanine amidase [Clostridia bacterium]|nr:N-acetylmuramoyl-L-alanine amidase [Clostridia bacterium]